MSADVVGQRAHILRTLELQPGEAVLDIGSGPGFLTQSIAEHVGQSGCVHGVDVSPDMVARSQARNASDTVIYTVEDASALSANDASFDVVVSVQVAEYVADITAFCREVFRVLRPGGRGLLVATDWHNVLWHSEYPDRMRHVLQAFQSHCAHSTLPRDLGVRLRHAGFSNVSVSAYPIVNTTWAHPCYSRAMAEFIVGFVYQRAALTEEVLNDWLTEQLELDRSGRLFFCSNRFLFAVQRPK